MGEIRFVGTGETRGYSYLVCKKKLSQTYDQKPTAYQAETITSAFSPFVP